MLQDRRTLLYLFIGFRLMMLIVYQPTLTNGPDRGLTAFGDFHTYYDFASLSAQGKLPYRDYWYEFPPVFPIISLLVYSIVSARGVADFTAYAVLLGLIITAFDVGNLILIGRIGRRVHGDSTAAALSWVYALLAAPFVFSWWTFEPIVTFSILLAIFYLIQKQLERSALAVAFGALTKLFPLILMAVAIRFQSIRSAIRYAVISLGLAVLGLIGMFAIGSSFGVPSLTAQFNKASYESIWALIDRNYKTGNFGSVTDRFDPAKAAELQGNPPVIPSWLRLIVFGGIGLVIFVQMRRFDERGVLAFAAITITLFFLWAQGWSPQWQVTLIPLILLNFPTRDGVLACLALGLVSFVEYPALFARTGETGGVISPAQLSLFTALILTRTALLTGFVAALFRRLRQPAVEKTA